MKMGELKNICLLEIGLWKLFKRYWKMPPAQIYETDGYKVYEVLPRNRHIVRKKKGVRISRNESLHSKLRSYLACLRRRTKAFSKTLESLERNLYLFSIYHLFE